MRHACSPGDFRIRTLLTHHGATPRDQDREHQRTRHRQRPRRKRSQSNDWNQCEQYHAQ